MQAVLMLPVAAVGWSSGRARVVVFRARRNCLQDGQACLLTKCLPALQVFQPPAELLQGWQPSRPNGYSGNHGLSSGGTD
jgi:hypothetical protein